MDLEHPPLTEASRHQPGKPVPWGGLHKEPDGGLAAAQTMDWLQVHTQGLRPLLAPRGSPHHLIPVCIWEQYNFSPAYWKARRRGFPCETRHTTWTSWATPHTNSSQTHKKEFGSGPWASPAPAEQVGHALDVASASLGGCSSHQPHTQAEAWQTGSNSSCFSQHSSGGQPIWSV